MKDDKQARERFKATARKRNTQSLAKGEVPTDKSSTPDKKASEWYLKEKKPSYVHPTSSLGGYTMTQGRDVANEVTDKVSKETGVSQGKVKEYLIDWGQNPTDRPLSGELQKAASEKFKINPGGNQILNSNSPSQDTKSVLDAVYKDTQQTLKDNNIESVMLYRGVNISQAENIIDYSGNVLDSWTLDSKNAQAYAQRNGGKVIKMEVPAERIISTPFTGFGNLGDFEFVVLGGKNAGEAVVLN